jgi:hypothetical protein
MFTLSTVLGSGLTGRGKSLVHTSFRIRESLTGHLLLFQKQAKVALPTNRVPTRICVSSLLLGGTLAAIYFSLALTFVCKSIYRSSIDIFPNVKRVSVPLLKVSHIVKGRDLILAEPPPTSPTWSHVHYSSLSSSCFMVYTASKIFSDRH